MKRWFRPVAYSLILGLIALAVFAEPTTRTAADDFVLAAPRDASSPANVDVAFDAPLAAPANAPVPTLRARGDASFAPDLFSAPPPPPPVPVEVAAPVEAPIPELKVLGWLESGGMPQVFAELGGEAFALTPGELAGDVFRFDSLGAGTARFTYLPTGATREFAVSDPATDE